MKWKFIVFILLFVKPGGHVLPQVPTVQVLADHLNNVLVFNIYDLLLSYAIIERLELITQQ